ncbi:MAG: efflux RND transporter periplasmic adaptor subunit [Candidatus Aminicenantes bacterium]|nr:efflux RND transporter periplasmic adaptor subunit [Candidatus Aminicenantes bacterium]
MKKHRNNPFLVIFFGPLMALGLFVWSGCRHADEIHHHQDERSTEASINLSATSQKLIGLKTEVATNREYLIPLRAAGRIDFNPKNYAVVVARCSGRVEKVLAYEGEAVEKGQELLYLFSPEHQALLAEYWQARERSIHSYSQDKELAERMLASVVRRLHLIGVKEEEIDALKLQGMRPEFLTVRSPLRGKIISRSVNNGEYIETGRELFRLADLSLLWVEISIFEKDLIKISIPGDCEVRVEAYPNRTFKARVTLLADFMDEATRTFKLRAEVPNYDYHLKPGMYADIYLWPKQREKILAVPEKAVRRLEGEATIFIQTGPETFSLRLVKLGRSFNGLIEILDGLKEGEVYVTDGSFSLKSEVLKKVLEGEGHEHKH